MPDDLLVVGRVARAHGNRGQVIVNPDTDFAEDRFRPGSVLIVGGPAGSAARVSTAVRFHQGRPIIALEGIESMNDAEMLAGAELSVRAAEIAPLPAGTYHRHDLVGCEVRDEQHGVVGRVREVEGTLERSWLVVEGARGDVLVPLAEEICRRVDPAAGIIVVRLPEGLLELNETRRIREPGGGR